MKFNIKLVEHLMRDRSLNFRFVEAADVLYSTGEEAGIESIGNVARITENTDLPLEIVLTMHGNYKLYDKNGTMVKFLDHKYYTLEDVIFCLRKI